MDRRYREELEQVRLTEESKRELVRALEARRELAAEGMGTEGRAAGAVPPWRWPP